MGRPILAATDFQAALQPFVSLEAGWKAGCGQDCPPHNSGFDANNSPKDFQNDVLARRKRLKLIRMEKLFDVGTLPLFLVFFFPIILHLTDRRRIGGWFGSNSFASSNLAEAQIYLEQVWELGDRGKFVKPVDSTRGVLILEKQLLLGVEFFSDN